jgi:hypothetical protein
MGAGHHWSRLNVTAAVVDDNRTMRIGFVLSEGQQAVSGGFWVSVLDYDHGRQGLFLDRGNVGQSETQRDVRNRIMRRLRELEHEAGGECHCAKRSP